MQADVVVIGGGLTGIFAAERLAKNGVSVVVIDNALPQAEGKIGGFARFSGAKFSLPPAGMGLLSLAGSEERLNSIIESIIDLLKLPSCLPQPSIDLQRDNGISLRQYQSYLLTPEQISELLDRLTNSIQEKARLIHGRVDSISPLDNGWNVRVLNGSLHNITANAVFYAAGRLSDGVLLKAGAMPYEGKGLDIGVRIEFADRKALQGLRALGPDAKILQAECRTFCLNSPGLIYNYPFAGFSIPGGVVADENEKSGNVGLLLRVSKKKERLRHIAYSGSKIAESLAQASSKVYCGSEFYLDEVLHKLFGEEECIKIKGFAQSLNQEKLIDLSFPHRVHMPLIDWHWNTFAAPSSHKTSLPNVFALGDSSGHARGLLQACISGWLAAEEYLC
ncbi:FAD-dependent oxidoreductase [Delftia tsuruhatensis]|uniref:FAD-dependent oxidoreductase n=1 Tax=Delftia tsuruhatensis TaxID=180282 RepID=UPI000B19EB77|nr:FAD-dependent oxidoreductase [Delftia tsuruhatensis]